MANPVIQLDSLEVAWRTLAETIRRKEAELSAMKQEFQILDQARALLLMRANPGAGVSLPVLGTRRAIGLKEAILECLAASEFGLDMYELIPAVAAKVDADRYAHERSLYAAVQTTLRRMIARGEIAMTVHDEKRRYIVAPSANVSMVTAAGGLEAA